MLHHGQALKTCRRERPDMKGHILHHPFTKALQNEQIRRKLTGHQWMLGNETRVDAAQTTKVPSGAETILVARRLHRTLYSDGLQSINYLWVEQSFSMLLRAGDDETHGLVNALHQRATALAFDKATVCLCSRSHVHASQRSTGGNFPRYCLRKNFVL